MTDETDDSPLSTCEQERLERIGAIQPYGVLLGGDLGDDQICFASADAAGWLGLGEAQVLGRRLGEVVALSLGDFPPTPGGRQLIAGLVESPRGWLDAVLCRTATSWLAELEPPGADDPPTQIANPLLRRLFQAPTADAEWSGYAAALADAVRRTTGYERVMVYRFLPDACGEVIAESTADELPRYLGLRFPAADIPRIARDLYRQNSHRQIPDIQAVPVPLEVLPGTDPDLSRSDLRAVSPVHLRYLANMGVAASLSFSILVGGNLWGLVACHHRRPRFLSVTVREQCVELTQAYALGISAFLAHRRLRRVSGLDADLEALADLVLDVTQRRHPTAALERGLLDLFQAGGAALVDAQGINSFGQVPTQREIRAIDDWFTGQPGDEVLATDRLAAESGLTLDLERAAGVLAVRVRPRRAGGPDRRCYWFRPEQARTVRWAGDPNKDAGADPATAALNPRRSFDLWVETTRGLCAPWDDLDLMAARKLRLLLRRSGLPTGTWL